MCWIGRREFIPDHQIPQGLLRTLRRRWHFIDECGFFWGGLTRCDNLRIVSVPGKERRPDNGHLRYQCRYRVDYRRN